MTNQTNTNEFIVSSEIENIIDSAIKVCKATKGTLCDLNSEVTSLFFASNVTAACSIFHILVEENKYEIRDIPSAFVLLRSVFERFVLMHYIFINSQSKEEIDFKMLLFERHASKELVKILKNIHTSSPDIDLELEKITAINEMIKKNSFFNKLDKSKQDKYFDKNYKFVLNISRYINEGNISYLNAGQGLAFYKQFSNYTHSQNYAINQMRAITHGENTASLVKYILDNTSIFLAFTIDVYSIISDQVSAIVKRDKTFIKYIEDYKSLLKEDLRTVKKYE